MDRWSVMRPLAIGAIACSLTCLLGTYLATVGPTVSLLALYLPYAAAAVLALGVALRRPGLVTTASALVLFNFLMAGRTIELIGASSLAAPVTAAGLFAIPQFGWWAIDLTLPAHEPPDALLMRVGELLLGSIGVGVVALLVLQVEHLSPGSGLQFVFIGAGLSVLFLVAVTAHARHARPRLGPVPQDHWGLLGHHPYDAIRPMAPRYPRIWAMIRNVRGSAYTPRRAVSRDSVIGWGWALLVLLVFDFAFAPAMAPVLVGACRASAIMCNAPIGIDLPATYATAATVGAVAVGMWLRRLVLYQAQGDARSIAVAAATASTRQDPVEWQQILAACNRTQSSLPPGPELRSMLTAIASRLPQLRRASASVSDAATRDRAASRLSTDTGPSSRDALLHTGDLGPILTWLESSSDV